MDKATVARFWSRVDKNWAVPARAPQLGPCWIWRGKTRKDDRGMMVANGREQRVSRISWQIHAGHAPGALSVLHKCDNPRCVNPRHLFLGTALDNVRDMDAKGRRVTVAMRGSSNGNSKLRAEDVIRIRDLYTAGTTQPVLCKMYGIAQSSVSRIVLSKGWPDVLASKAPIIRERNKAATTGEANHNAKMTAASVRRMRERFGNGAGIAQLASAFSLSKTSTRKIVNRTSWRHVA